MTYFTGGFIMNKKHFAYRVIVTATVLMLMTSIAFAACVFGVEGCDGTGVVKRCSNDYKYRAASACGANGTACVLYTNMYGTEEVCNGYWCNNYRSAGQHQHIKTHSACGQSSVLVCPF